MEQKEIHELHGLIAKLFLERDKKPSEVISFLTCMWVGQMCLNGYTEQFVDATLKRMKDQWETHEDNKWRSNKK